MTLVYLASPYSHADLDMRIWRYQQAVNAVADLFDKNFFVFSPVVHWHPVALHHNLRWDFEFWKAYDRELVSRCDVVFVLQLHGWQQSAGVTDEIEFAQELGKHVEYIEPNEHQRISKHPC